MPPQQNSIKKQKIQNQQNGVFNAFLYFIISKIPSIRTVIGKKFSAILSVCVFCIFIFSLYIGKILHNWYAY